jgi:hypothetical protein
MSKNPDTHTNDWENKLKGALLLRREEPVEVIFSGGVSKTISMIPWSLFVLAIDKLLSDEKQELMTKMEKIITEDQGCCNCPNDRIGQLEMLTDLKKEGK